MNPQKSAMSILLVEDNPADVYLLKTALAEMGIETEIQVFGDGMEAWGHLNQVPDGETVPDLIILDLNLPGMSGREILDLMLRTPPLRSIPVAVFSGSRYESGVTEDYRGLHIVFATKSFDYDELKETLSRIVAFAGDVSEGEAISGPR